MLLLVFRSEMAGNEEDTWGLEIHKQIKWLNGLSLHFLHLCICTRVSDVLPSSRSREPSFNHNTENIKICLYLRRIAAINFKFT